MKIVNETTGKELVKGDEVTTFRGEKAIYVGFTPESSGRVAIKFDAELPDHDAAEFYPSVIGARIVL